MRTTLADDIELAFQCIGHQHIIAATNKDLANDRFLGLDHRGHGTGGVDRHIPPAQHNLAFGTDGALNLFFPGHPRRGLLRQENHPDPVLTGGRQHDTLFGHLIPEELVWDLDQNTGTVPLQRVSTNGTSVIQILQDQQSLLNDTVALLPLHMGYKTYRSEEHTSELQSPD